MSSFQEMPKAYDASTVEDAIYASWEKSGAFQPKGNGEPYCIVMPPPNRTGVLHIGHAVMLAIEDLLIRYHRMRGMRALWIPGTDHAAIATQIKVEQILREQGMKDPRRELGRERFLDKVVAFAEESATVIRNQIRKMGSSCDWTREKYTLDEERTRAVNEMFRMMYEDGLIERGDRIVNWDPKMQSNVSDDEIEWVEETAPFYTFQYGPFEISTARPETKFGDKYVVMHPDDKRYEKYKHGDKFECEWITGKVTATVIKDEVVDPEFGTGVMTITPWHDATDFEIAERHHLDKEQIIDFEGRLLSVAGEFEGMTIEEARPKIVEKLKKKGLLKAVDDKYLHRIATNYRGGGRIEPQIMRQWFVRVNKPFALRQDTLGKWKKGETATLKELMRCAVESKQIKIVPERFEKTYFHWIDNLRDWCISRQIWFGHRIPVWYEKESRSQNLESRRSSPDSKFKIQDSSPGSDWEQDPDTLDTWFSSGLWTFSTLGWPPLAEATGGKPDEWSKMREFHPTAVLETGYDILFFWVARMILMSTYALGEVPFYDVYLHGLIRDEQGRKMSKSLGNVIDPLDMIAKYGTDAVRLALMLGTTPGQDTKLSEEKIADFRNFTNKLWNISRFILMQIGDNLPSPLLRKEGDRDHILPLTSCLRQIRLRRKGELEGVSLADRWILSRLSEVTASVTSKIEKYGFSSAGEELRDFTWGDLADWYLEIAKIEKGKEEILANILPTILKLWHPFMPFVTEHVWKTAGFDGDLITAKWPEVTKIQFTISPDTPFRMCRSGSRSKHRDNFQTKDFETIKQIITDIRRLRAEQGIEPVKKVEVVISCPVEIAKLLEENKAVAEHLSRASAIKVVDSIPDGWATTVSGASTIALNVAGSVDIEKERAKLEKEIVETETYLKTITMKLKNKEFISKAPEKIREEMEARRGDAEAKLQALKDRIGGC